MFTLRHSSERGHANHGWLDTYHTFSFADYFDPRFQGYRDLLVINEDRVKPGFGFGTHGHRDMEIITYVIEGELAHKDSMGTGSSLKYGDVQRMSAGTGVQHSEFNNSKEKGLHLIQIWIQPAQNGIRPEYEEKHFSEAEKTNQLRLIVSPNGQDGSLHIHQDAKLYASRLDSEHTLTYEIKQGRNIWIQMIRGEIDVNSHKMSAGDGASMTTEKALTIHARQSAEFLLFDLA